MEEVFLIEILLVLEYWKFCLAIDEELLFDGADCVKCASSELVRVRFGHCGGVLAIKTNIFSNIKLTLFYHDSPHMYH